MDGDSVLNVIRTVVREHHWDIEQIEDLFWDEKDHKGLLFWYNDILEMNKKIEEKYKNGRIHNTN